MKGRYRCLVKSGDTWQQEHPADLLRWLWAHDSVDIDALVIDDSARPKMYYCSNEGLRDAALAEGKHAAMFFDMEVIL